MNAAAMPTPEFSSEDHSDGGLEGAENSGQTLANPTSSKHGLVEAWISEAESQVAMRRALMDCYNG